MEKAGSIQPENRRDELGKDVFYLTRREVGKWLEGTGCI